MFKTDNFVLILTVSAVILHGHNTHSLPYSAQDTNKLAEELHELQSRFEQLQGRVNVAERELTELKELNSVQADMSSATATPEVVPVNTPSSTTPNSVIDISVDSELGFSAKLSHELHDLPTFSVIKYDYVIFNAGNGYDPSTGIFTVPLEGMYMFTYFVEALGTQAAEIQLIVDGMIRFPAISEPESPGNDDTGGNMVIEHLVKGQQVWIETYESENQNIFPGFTTFSGALIP